MKKPHDSLTEQGVLKPKSFSESKIFMTTVRGGAMGSSLKPGLRAHNPYNKDVDYVVKEGQYNSLMNHRAA